MNAAFAVPLLAWYAAERRQLPWRDHPTPYWVWISEIMLQQTQVETVKPYYQRFMTLFPDVETLADAPEATLLKAWEGLGYYSRARNLHRAAKVVAHERGGKFPVDFAGWLELPGIGGYTAAAIASIAFGEPVPVVDGNVLRVVARLTADSIDIKAEPTKKKFFVALTPVIERSGDPSSFNQAMMELGALICKPKSPQCLLCPVQACCKAFAKNAVDCYPVTSKRAKVPHRHAVALIAEYDGKVCLRRRDERLWHGLYSFPVVEVESPEMTPSEVKKHFQAVGFEPKGTPKPLQVVRHAFTHFTLDIHPWRVRVSGGGEGEWEAPDAVTLPLPVPIRALIDGQLL